MSEIGHGTWGIGGWSDSNDEESLLAVQQAVDLGCNFFDTAWAYGAGRSEKLLARLIRANPSTKIHAATKVPPRNSQWPSRRGFTVDDCFPPAHITEFAYRSLENLDLERIDLLQLHTWEDAWLEDRRWYDALCSLREEGVIAAIGISLNRWEPWNGVRAVRSGLVDCVQVIYNIFDQSPEDELFEACEEMDVGIIARVPFDEGTLVGALTRDSHWPEGDWRNTYFVPENLIPAVERANDLSGLLPPGMLMPEMALRFILTEPRVSTVIPGMRRRSHVEANVRAAERGPLSKDLHAALRGHRWDRQPTDWSQ